MAADRAEVETYFKHVVQQYNCGDIEQLLKLVPAMDKLGPLLASVVNGIDTVGGMMLGFEERSNKRSTEFMRQHLRLAPEEADLVYALVRCGVAHEGVTKLAVQFFAHFDEAEGTSPRVRPGVFLYRDARNSILLNVAELAYSYLDAIKRIADDIHSHLKYIPAPRPKEVEMYRNALAVVKAGFEADYVAALEKGDVYSKSGNPFIVEHLHQFTAP
jgi:hypothetical protein